MSDRDYPLLRLIVLLFLEFLPYIRPITQPYKPVDLILLNCGSDSSSTSLDGRIWDGDARSKFLPSYSKASSSAFSASQPDPSFNQVPYTTARIFHSNLTYTFPVSPGSKFVRLYLYPTAYSNLNISESFLSLTANDYLLLRNFSAFLTLSALKAELDSYHREYIVTVRDNQQLNLTFSVSPGSFGFINGIEIVSIPDNLYAGGNDNPLIFVDASYSFYLNDNTALEMFYRLNVGGNDISGSDDTGMYRTWLQDIDFIFGRFDGIIPFHGVPFKNKIEYTSVTPAYTAPESVYATVRSMGERFPSNANLTWRFSVDEGFNYLVRLHFCETRAVVSKEMLEVFEIFINNQIVENDADVIHWSGGNKIPVYRDYVVWIPEGNRGKQDLRLTLRPNFELKPKFADAILNGVEIFKMNNSEGSLAGSNAELMGFPPPLAVSVPIMHAGERNFSKFAVVIGSVIGAILVLSLAICVVLFRKWIIVDSAKSLRVPLSYTLKSNSGNVPWRSFITLSSIFGIFVQQKIRKKDDSVYSENKPFQVQLSCSSTGTILLSVPTHRCHIFTIDEIREATRNFNDQNIIGSGGFGDIYKGYLENGGIPVAVKRLRLWSQQGSHEFTTEIEMLYRLRHVNLVSLIGFCFGEGEMILVHDYMINGTLRQHLYETNNDPIPWKKRLQICIGAARGLYYLHSGMEHTIIHRDVKTTNILLDEKWIAKVSDFGLSKVALNEEVSTVVKGTWGYLDPEYARYQQLTEKSDVYSFGVALFEVLCARKPLNHQVPVEQINLVIWARKCIQNGTFHQLVDPYLNGTIAPECLNKFLEVATSCVHHKGIERPKMRDVMGELEFALELQETADSEMKKTKPGGELVYSDVAFIANSCMDVGGGPEPESTGLTSFTITDRTILESPSEILMQ